MAETSASVYQAALVTLPCADGVFEGTASAIRFLALPQLVCARVATDYKTNGARVKTIRCGNQMKSNIDISPGEYRYCLDRILILFTHHPGQSSLPGRHPRRARRRAVVMHREIKAAMARQHAQQGVHESKPNSCHIV